MNRITEVLSSCPENLDLTSREHADILYNLCDAILETEQAAWSLSKITSEIDTKNLFFAVALKMAESKFVVRSIKKRLYVSVVFAVYKEHNRILNEEEHENGEDFLRRKCKQLDWLIDDSEFVKWELIIVDDGCPEGSGKIAQKIITESGLEKKVMVHFLDDGIAESASVTKGLKSSSDSQKGGSVIYGMYKALEGSISDDHIIIYTDADLSTHLGQVGLLLDPIINKNKKVCIGSRRKRSSVVIKQGSRNERGKLFIYIWKQLINLFPSVIDTQCGFKAFHKSVLEKIIEKIKEKKFAFDIELLIKAEILEQGSIYRTSIAWIDSEAASTTTDLQPYLPMLKSISRMYKDYLPSTDRQDQLADFISEIKQEDFDLLLSNIPEGITSREPREFVNYSGVGVDEIRKAIREKNKL